MRRLVLGHARRLASQAEPPSRLYEQIVQRFDASTPPPRSLLHEFLHAVNTPSDGELAANAYSLFARKDRPPLPSESTALLIRSSLRTRNFEPVLALLEACKWNGLQPTESQLQAMQAELEREQDWARLERLFNVRLNLQLVSSVDALRSAQRALIAQGRLRCALRAISPAKSATAPLVRSFMFTAVFAACADAEKHSLAKMAWAQLRTSGLAPNERCVVQAMRAVLTDKEQGAALAQEMFVSATDPAATPSLGRASLLAAAAQELPDFTSEHLASYGGTEAVSAIERTEAAAVVERKVTPPAPAAPAPAVAAAPAKPPVAELAAEKPKSKDKDEPLRDGRDDSLL